VAALITKSLATGVSIVASLLCLVVLAGYAHAELPSSKVEVKVTVSDEVGAVIPGCEVTFNSDVDKIVSHTEPDGSVAASLPAGEYVVTITKAGFVKTTVSLQIRAASSNTLRAVLKVDQTPIVDRLPGADAPTTTFDLPIILSTPPDRESSTGKSRSWRASSSGSVLSHSAST
jgi:hypothetical protein